MDATSIPPGSVTIRPAAPADSATIRGLVRALADFERLPPPDEAAQARLLADAFGPHPRFEIFLAEVAGQVAAYAFVFETYSTFLALPTLYLEDLFVLPDHRGQRIGYALMQFCAREAVRRGCGRLDWAVLDWNTQAIAFYDRLGGRPLDDWRLYRLDGAALAALGAGA
jgi:GNAT superfamily N-acetyltransferase